MLWSCRESKAAMDSTEILDQKSQSILCIKLPLQRIYNDAAKTPQELYPYASQQFS
jgi:hypothetical protein